MRTRIIVLCFGLLFVLAACGDSASTATGTGQTNSAQYLAVESTFKTTVIAGKRTPPPDEVYFVIKVKVSNPTQKTLVAEDSAFSLTTKQQHIYTHSAVAVNLSDALISLTIAPGQSGEGSLVFSLPVNEDPVSLSFVGAENPVTVTLS